MGFETQEEAERWAENIEAAADARREETLLSRKVEDVSEPVGTDAERLAIMESNIRRDPAYAMEMLKLAYGLGRCAGRTEMGEMAIQVISGK